MNMRLHRPTGDNALILAIVPPVYAYAVHSWSQLADKLMVLVGTPLYILFIFLSCIYEEAPDEA